jgi:hypothetical protein
VREKLPLRLAQKGMVEKISPKIFGFLPMIPKIPGWV